MSDVTKRPSTIIIAHHRETAICLLSFLSYFPEEKVRYYFSEDEIGTALDELLDAFPNTIFLVTGLDPRELAAVELAQSKGKNIQLIVTTGDDGTWQSLSDLHRRRALVFVAMVGVPASVLTSRLTGISYAYVHSLEIISGKLGGGQLAMLMSNHMS